MSSFVQCSRAFQYTAALAKYRAVKVVAGLLAYCGSTDVGVGTIQETTFAKSEAFDATVKLLNGPGTHQMVAAGAITAFNPVYAAANGKIASAGTVLRGYAMQAATADGDIIEVLPLPNTDLSTAISGTTAATFEADSDSGKPRMALGSQTGGTGDYKVVLKPPATLTGDHVATYPVDADANLLTDYCQTVNPAANDGTGSVIKSGVRAVNVGAVVNDANDWIRLPPIADYQIGDTIRIACNAGSNFELRTPAASNTKINDVDSDGSQEHLCTDTDLVIVTKLTATAWVAQSLTKLGAVRTAVVPD